MSRRSPPFAIIVAVVAFVFAQLMGAAHACEMGFPGKAQAAAVAAPALQDCCGEGTPAPMDASCHNHCQQANSAPERVNPGAAMPAPAAAIAPPASTSVRIADPPPRASSPAPDLARHTGPSISIRNCCFRI